MQQTRGIGLCDEQGRVQLSNRKLAQDSAFDASARADQVRSQQSRPWPQLLSWENNGALWNAMTNIPRARRIFLLAC